jgi:hypothetical protein
VKADRSHSLVLSGWLRTHVRDKLRQYIKHADRSLTKSV